MPFIVYSLQFLKTDNKFRNAKKENFFYLMILLTGVTGNSFPCITSDTICHICHNRFCANIEYLTVRIPDSNENCSEYKQ